MFTKIRFLLPSCKPFRITWKAWFTFRILGFSEVWAERWKCGESWPTATAHTSNSLSRTSQDTPCDRGSAVPPPTLASRLSQAQDNSYHQCCLMTWPLWGWSQATGPCKASFKWAGAVGEGHSGILAALRRLDQCFCILNGHKIHLGLLLTCYGSEGRAGSFQVMPTLLARGPRRALSPRMKGLRRAVSLGSQTHHPMETGLLPWSKGGSGPLLPVFPLLQRALFPQCEALAPPSSAPTRFDLPLTLPKSSFSWLLSLQCSTPSPAFLLRHKTNVKITFQKYWKWMMMKSCFCFLGT